MERPKQNYESTEMGVRDGRENIRALRTATKQITRQPIHCIFIIKAHTIFK